MIHAFLTIPAIDRRRPAIETIGERLAAAY